MIKTTELRLGNLVASVVGGKGSPFKVVGINEKSVRLETAGGKVVTKNSDFIYPIKVTPNILEQVGARVLRNVSKVDRKIYSFGKDNNIGWIEVDGVTRSVELDINTETVEVESLHHLQNIYYIVVGDELNVDNIL